MFFVDIQKYVYFFKSILQDVPLDDDTRLNRIKLTDGDTATGTLNLTTIQQVLLLAEL